MSFLVLSPGLASSLQDLGRFGYLDRGLAPSGALDQQALAIANALAGNPPDMAALEMIGQGARLEVQAERVRIGLAGCFALSIDGQPKPSWRSYMLTKGQVLELGAVGSLRAGYLAVQGGFDLPPFLGSQSSYARARIGMTLQTGLSLPLAQLCAPLQAELFWPDPDLAPPHCLRVIMGPQENAFTPEAKQHFLNAGWRVSRQADRMGIRLDGPKLVHQGSPDIPSEGLVQGCIQVPGDGRPILLLADHQTTGGYAKIATVISADLPLAGRLMPGSEFHFKPVSWPEAKDALSARRNETAAKLASIRKIDDIDMSALMSANLISGAIDALDGSEMP